MAPKPTAWQPRVAALPKTIAQDDDHLDSAAPGHRFWLYLRQWQDASNGQLEVVKKERADSLGEACRLPAASQAQLAALLRRQDSLMQALGQAGYTLNAEATAPLTTGLGLPHPTDNGFAFLSPYGLPYLPGSGIKGVVRRAAELLVQPNGAPASNGWTLADLQCLFGGSEEVPHEETSSAGQPSQGLSQEQDGREAALVRGALHFWDALAQPHGHALVVEVMTRHHDGYLQHGQAPHEAEQPVPVPFLALPPGSELRFHVRCALDRLTDRLRREDRWRTLLRDAFECAFDAQGFGAKTAVGYGALRRKEALVGQAEESAGNEELWPAARLHYSPGRREVWAVLSSRVTAPLAGKEAQALLDELGAERSARLQRKHQLGPLDVRVRRQENLLRLLGLARLDGG